MSLVFLSPRQNNSLRRLAARVKALNPEPLTVKVAFVPAHGHVFPGRVCLTARSCSVFSRLARMVKRIVPEAKLDLEHGHGWFSGDRTPYHHSEFIFMNQP